MDNKKLLEKVLSDKIPKQGIRWLIETGYLTAPNDMWHGEAYEGGLLEHSLNVTSSLLYLTDKLGLRWSRVESPYIIGMLHDVCKIDQYVWNPIEKRYEWNDKQTIFGHGSKSVELIENNIIHLTKEEQDCILWHMGVDDNYIPQTYIEAVSMNDNVLWTRVADMMSRHIIEKDRYYGKHN